MAKYNVTFSCGHQERRELFGKMQGRYSTIEYWEIMAFVVNAGLLSRMPTAMKLKCHTANTRIDMLPAEQNQKHMIAERI